MPSPGARRPTVRGPTIGSMDSVSIRDESIKLGQLLKLHGVAENGAIAKELIAAGEVRVNGDVETRRGRTVVPGDVGEVADVSFSVTAD